VVVIIAWVEGEPTPARLNAKAISDVYEGQTMELCRWPARPIWASSTSVTFECAYDRGGIDNWIYTYNAFKVPVS
jgi:tannase